MRFASVPRSFENFELFVNADQPGEQATMFLPDPCGNALEFKAFADRSKLFAK